MENQTLGITVCHHWPKGDPHDKFFYPTLTLMIDSYILTLVISPGCRLVVMQLKWYCIGTTMTSLDNHVRNAHGCQGMSL